MSITRSFKLEELKEWEWNPLVYNQSLADSLYLLVARDFAPAEKRIPNLRKRLEAIPTVIAQAKANLQASAARSYRDRDRANAGRDFASCRKVSVRCSIRRRK